MNESPHPDCIMIWFEIFCPSLRGLSSDLLTWTARLSWAFPVFHRFTVWSFRWWRLCNESMKPIQKSLFKESSRINAKYCAGYLGIEHILIEGQRVKPVPSHLRRIEAWRKEIELAHWSAGCGDRWPTVTCQTRSKSKHCSVPPTKVSSLVGWYTKDSILRMCNRQNRYLCRFDGSRGHKFYSSMFIERKITSKAMPDSCRDAVPPLRAWFIPHAECNVNGSPHPDWITLGFGKPWVHLSAVGSVSNLFGVIGEQKHGGKGLN